MKQAERGLEQQIKGYLLSKGCLIIKHRSTGRYVAGRLIPLPKDELGVADLIGCYKGLFFAIEVKVGNNSQTIYQKRFEQDVLANDGIYAVIKSLDEAREFFTLIVGKHEGRSLILDALPSD